MIAARCGGARKLFGSCSSKLNPNPNPNPNPPPKHLLIDRPTDSWLWLSVCCRPLHLARCGYRINTGSVRIQ